MRRRRIKRRSSSPIPDFTENMPRLNVVDALAAKKKKSDVGASSSRRLTSPAYKRHRATDV